MIQRFLLFLGFPTLNLRAVAGRLADEMILEYGHNYNLLDEAATKDVLRTRYMRLSVRYGLPPEVQGEVADMAWRRICRTVPAEVGDRAFSFYP